MSTNPSASEILSKLRAVDYEHIIGIPETLQALHSAILSRMPEKIVFDDPELAEHNKDFTQGFNAALTDIKQVLNDFFLRSK